MKKFLSVVITCILCVSMFGCVSDEEKFEREWNAWVERNLNYETFSLDSARQNFFIWNGTAREWDDYTFIILSSDDILRESLKMDFDSEEEFAFRPFPYYDTVNIDYPVIKKDEQLTVLISYEWGKQIDSVSCTLHYTATDGRTVSKDYVLDFTQTPFRDFRNR